MPRKCTVFYNLEHEINGISFHATLSVPDVCKALDVSPKTVRRWIDGTQAPSPHSIELLKIRVFGILPDPDFSGFRVESGFIKTPSGQTITPSDLESMAWLRGLYSQGIRDNDARRKEMDQIAKMMPQVDHILRKQAEKRLREEARQLNQSSRKNQQGKRKPQPRYTSHHD